MKITFKVAILLIFGVTRTFFLFSQNKNNEYIFVVSEQNLARQNISVNKHWAFYKYQLYTPEDFISGINTKPEPVNLPHLWNKTEKSELSSGQGYGTYRIVISGLQKGKMYALNINRIQSSYHLFVDGKLINTVGVPGVEKKHSKPGWSAEDIYFSPSKSNCEIIIQVTNFYHKKGGIENDIILGTAENIYKRANKLSALTIFLIGILMIMAAYHLGMYFFKRNVKANLYFALAMISTGLFSLTVSEIHLIRFIPELNWQILVKTNYISNYLRLIFFIIFIYYAFQKHLNKRYVTILVIAGLINIAFILVAPAGIFTHTLIVFLIITSISLLYVFYAQINAIFKKQPGALISFLGILALLIAAFNDILKELQFINTITLSTFGLFIFIIFNSYSIAINNAHSYRTIKAITEILILQGKVKNTLFSGESYYLKAPLKAVAESVDTDRALIFIFRNNNWIAGNEYLKEDNTLKELNINVFSTKENVFFSARIVKMAISSKEPVFIVANDAEKAKDHEYLEGSKIVSMLAYPLIKDNLTQSLLYFENYRFDPKFKDRTLSIIKSVASHLSVFMNNFTAYNQLSLKNQELEDKIAEATAQIENKSNELKKLRTEIETQNISIEETSKKLEIQNQSINDGIRYAIKIQTAFLTSEKQFKEMFPNSFIFNKPAGALSGDFYKFERFNEHECIIIVADSSGKDISGALMSIIGIETLNQIILNQEVKSPKIILNNLQEIFSNRILKDDDTVGFDLSVIYYNSINKELVFSGAQHSFFFIKNNDIIEFKGTPVSIGHSDIYKGNEGKRFFSNKRISVKNGDVFYMFTDGFAKQVNGETQRKYQKNNFKELLISIRNEDFNRQHQILESELMKWKGNEMQTDDILITGIKL